MDFLVVKNKFVKIVFNSISAMNKYKGLWNQYINNEVVRKNLHFKKVELELYESNIPPLLRYFHINNISPSGWASINTSR